MALLSIYRGTQAEVSERPVSDGALLFATDTKKIYLDKGSSRVEMSSLQDLSNYITSTQLSSAIGAEASARQKQDQLLEQAIDDKLGADDIIAGSNVQISHDDESGHITISATDTKDTNTTYTLTKSGSTITLNGSDGSETSVTDSNTTYTLSSFGVTATATELNYMDGVTSNVQTQLNGKAASSHTHSTASTTAAGFLRQLNGSTSNFLRGDGTWATPPNTTYSAMKGASSSTAGSTGLVPAPAAGASNRYLRSDGTWAVPPDTNTTYTLSSFGITATAAELNKLDGVTATATEINYLDGVTSAIQTQLNGKAASSHSHPASQVTGLTASRALVSDSGGHPAVSTVTSTELGYLDGVTSAIQTQLNNKASTNHTHSYLPLSGGTLSGTVTSRSLAAATDSTYDIGTSSVRYRNIYADNLYGTLQGSVTSANKLTTARTISLTGDVTGSTSFNGSANVSISANLAANSVTANEIAAGAVGSSEIASNAVTLTKLGSDVGTVAVQSTQPTDTNVKLWIQT